MNAQQHDDAAVADVQAFLGIWLAPGRDLIERIHADRAYELRGSDLLEVLRLLAEARAENGRLRNLTTLPPCPYVPPCQACIGHTIMAPSVHWAPHRSPEPDLSNEPIGEIDV